MLRFLLLPLTLLLAAIAPAAADAASVSKVGTELVYRSGDLGSYLSIEWDPYTYGAADPRITFTDLGDSTATVVTPGAGCDRGTRPDSQYFASCKVAGITQIRLEGEGGNDTMGPYSSVPVQYKLLSRGGPGNDSLTDRSGTVASSSFDGGPGIDSIQAYEGNDTLVGGPDDATDGADSLNAGDGIDTVRAGGGDDYVYGDYWHDPAFADTIHGQSGNDNVESGYGKDKVYGGAGNDKLYGDGDADVLAGEAGDDYLEPDPTSSGVTAATYAGDVMSGGTGTDTVGYAYRDQYMRLSLDGVANDAAEGEKDNIDADRGVENLQPSEGGNEIRLDDKDNAVSANRGDWYGPGGDDVIYGRGGNDRIDTGTGDDIVDGGAGDDRLRDGGEHDALLGGEGNDELIGNSTADEFDPGPGEDKVFGSVGYDDTVAAADGAADAIHCGGVYDDDLVEADGADTLVACERVLRVTTTRAGVANGVLAVQAPAGQANALTVRQLTATTFKLKDVHPLAAGANCTRVTATEVNCATVTALKVDAGDKNDTVTVTGPRGAAITGGPGNDTLTGGTGADQIDGGPGGDVIAGGGGIDTAQYATRAGAVTVDIDGVRDDGNVADNPTTSLRDNVKTDVENLTGGSGADVLTGSGAANVIDGGAGGDIISGLGGADTVTYAGRTLGVVADLDGIRDDGSGDDNASVVARDNVKVDVENLTGGAGADTLSAIRADFVVNVLTGNHGDDRLKTRDGSTTVDKLVCGYGIDRYDRDGSDTVSACDTAATLP